MQRQCCNSCIDTSDATTTNTIPAPTKDTIYHATPYPFVICLGSSTGVICILKGELGWEAVSLFEADKTCVNDIASLLLLAFKTHGTAVLLLPYATVLLPCAAVLVPHATMLLLLLHAAGLLLLLHATVLLLPHAAVLLLHATPQQHCPHL